MLCSCIQNIESAQKEVTGISIIRNSQTLPGNIIKGGFQKFKRKNFTIFAILL